MHTKPNKSDQKKLFIGPKQKEILFLLHVLEKY